MTRPEVTPSQWPLRPWQSEALRAWLLAGRRGVVEVATGGGKTRFALACVSAIGPEIRYVQIIVPTIALADQWHIALEEDLRVDKSDVASLSSRSRATNLRRFNVSVINSARELEPTLWTDGRFLIVDECHRAGSPDNARALGGTASATLGLSATPHRQYDDYFGQVIEPALGPIIYQYSIQQATLDGVLSPFHLTNVRVRLNEDEQREYDALTRRIGLAYRSDLVSGEERRPRLLIRRARVANDALVRIPVAVRLLERHRGERSLIFHESIEAAEGIADLLSTRGHSVTLYHSGIGASMRRENLRLFRRGVYDVLVTCKALDEGINIPEVRVAIIAAASASDRQRIQRLGRVLRPAEGKQVAEVYTIYATDAEQERLRAEAEGLAGIADVDWMRVGAPA
ncbi:DEAD/DEAH box helicase [Micromonospora cremea]|uniref:Superfamily II DNA or RNA helicase n=1 Tax=Micromonospora cremea TaxID=709881 RepID=A0A1N6ANI1_9ACTN|nr:DEAD/DEAH box helicase [Micromonospora cremea]SIN35488.1 Superfamily II DNA or RNA helicase [Micromonospora cremea]